jgi:hypothetical protein
MIRPSPKFAEAARLALIACRAARTGRSKPLLNALNRLLGDPRFVAYMKR